VSATKGFLEELFAVSPDAIVVAGGDGKITEANPRAEQMFGYTRGELLGQPVEILMPERFRHRHPGHRDKFVAAHAVRSMGSGLDLYGRRKDGSEFRVDILLSPIRGAAPGTVLNVIRDLTEK